LALSGPIPPGRVGFGTAKLRENWSVGDPLTGETRAMPVQPGEPGIESEHVDKSTNCNPPLLTPIPEACTVAVPLKGNVPSKE